MRDTIRSATILLCVFAVAVVCADRTATEVEGLTPTIISDCDDIAAISAVTPDAADIRTSELSTTAAARVNGSSVRWVVPQGQSQSAAVRINWRPDDLPSAVALWIKNPAGHRVTLSVEVDSPGGSTTLGSAKLGDERNWHQLAFPVTQVQGGDANGLVLRLQDLKPGESYEIYVDQIEAYRPPPLPLDVTITDLPEETSAGTRLQPTIHLTPHNDAAAWPQMRAVIAAGDVTVSTKSFQPPGQPSAQETVKVDSAAITLPRWVSGGRYELRLEGSGADIDVSQWPSVNVTNPAPVPEATVISGGRIAFDGAPVSPVMVSADVGGEIGDLPEGTVLLVDVTSDFDLYGRSADVLLGEGSYDYSALDRRLSRIMTACPRAAVLFRVHVSSPPWWDESHPGELVKFSTGSTELRGDGPARKRTHASWASENWRTAASASLEALISHLEASPFSRRIIGYELRSGEWGAWQYPGASRGLFADYGEPQQKAYRRWLSERYGSLSSLRAAWGQPVQPLTDSNAVEEGQPILSWQQVEVPSPKERKKSYPGMGVLREPAGSQHVIDYDLFASDLVVETITHLAEIVREVAPGRLCGASYGHIFDHSRVPYLLQNGGHLAVRRLLGVENVDFITTPTAAVADHDIATFSSVGASLAAHGKAAICIPEAVAGRSSSPRGLHTHVAQAIAGGSYLALDAADFAALDEPWRNAVTESAATSHGSRAEVAAVVDDVSCAYTVCGNDLVEPLLDRQRGGLTLLGAPVDVWLLSDIVAGRAPKYKLYVFMNAFYMPEKQREAIISRLAEHKASAIFIYAAGAIDDIISGRKMKALTGLWITRLRGRGPLQVALPDTTYGLAEPVEPRFIGVDRLIAADENAEVLASLQDTGYCGLAARKDGDVRIIWSGAPDMPAALLSKFARQAGIETTTERPAAVYASTDLVAICAPREGTYRVHLPENFHATDLLSGETVGSNDAPVLLDLHAGETALLRLRQIGDEEQ